MMKNYFTTQGGQLTSFKSCLLLFTLLFGLQSFAETDCGHITGFEFSNGNTSVSINNGQTYNINDLPNNFYVDLMVSGFTESASFKITNLSEDEEYFVGENYLPYTFPGGNGAWNFGTGNFKVVSKIFRYNQCQGYRCDKETIYFTLTNTVSCGIISGYEFSNGEDAVTIVDGGSYDINELPEDFYIDLLVDGNTESAALKVTNLQTGQVATAGENYLPYTFPNGNNAWYLGTGQFQVKSEIFKYNYCAGSVCDTETITFTLFEASDCGQIDEFVFTNGTDSTTLVDGGTYNVSDLPTNFYIDAIVAGDSESVRFDVANLDTNDSYSIIENYIPYTFPAGNGAWNVGLGTFEVSASVFDGNYCTSIQCDHQTITFTLVDTVPCDVFAGTATPEASSVLITGGNANITAIPNGDAILEAGYVLGTVLTQGPDLVIQAVSDSASISISLSGTFALHVLVYDPNTLDLSGIVFGQTTATDVLALIESNGICASLDAVGSPVTVISLGPDARAANTDTAFTKPVSVKEEIVVVKKEANTVEIESVDIKLYPNPVVSTLNVDLHLLDGEQMNYTMYDLNGRQVLKGGFDNLSLGSVKIDTKTISNGLYILKFSSTIRTFSKKIQVNK